MKKLFLVCAILFSCFLSAHAYLDYYYMLTAGTGEVAGTDYRVGVALGKLISIDRVEHGIRLKIEPTQGSKTNLSEIKKEIDHMALAIVQQDMLNAEYSKKGGSTIYRVLFGLNKDVYTVVARKGSGINNFEDVAGKKFDAGAAGSGTKFITDLLIKEYNWKNKDFAKLSSNPLAQTVAAFCDKEIDAFAFSVGNPTQAIEEAVGCGGYIVPVDGPKIDNFIKKNPIYVKAKIPGKTYKNNDKEITSFATKSVFITTEELESEVAYSIVKIIYENFDKLKSMVPGLEGLSKDDFLIGEEVPYHDGAIDYYKEIGVWKY